MEVDDSDEDEMTVQSPTVTPKRKKIGVCIADNPLAPPEPAILVPPPGGETPGKRSKLENNRSSGSKNPTQATTLQTQAAPIKAVDSSDKSV